MTLPRSPSPPPESSGLRAKDLRNQALLVRAGEYREEKSGRDDKPWCYYECDVILLDRAGKKQSASGVRISWSRTLAQLSEFVGEWMACRPVEDGNAVVLEPLTGPDLEVAERVLGELDG
jgi:hypothetical protein